MSEETAAMTWHLGRETLEAGMTALESCMRERNNRRYWHIVGGQDYYMEAPSRNLIPILQHATTDTQIGSTVNTVPIPTTTPVVSTLAVPAPTKKAKPGKAIFIPFPSGVSKAIVSFAKHSTKLTYTQAELILITEPRTVRCDVSKLAEKDRNIKSFEDKNCGACKFHRSYEQYLMELFTEAPEYLNRTVNEIEEAFAKRSEAENNCPKIREVLKTEVTHCKAGLRFTELKIDTEFAEVKVPSLALRMSIERWRSDTANILVLLKRKPTWYLYAYKEEQEDKPMIIPYRMANVHGSGAICWGRNPYPKNPKEAMNSYWASGFNYDLNARVGGIAATGNLKAYLESYTVPKTGYFELKTALKKDLILGSPTPTIGLFVSSYANILKAVPADKHILEEGDRRLVMAWVTKDVDGSFILNCRGSMFKTTALDSKAKIVPYTEPK